MTFSEPILESLLQVCILWCLYSNNPNPQLLSGQNTTENVLFIATFSSSLFSAAKGLADFLLNGPCKLLPNDGLFGGMGKMGYIFLLINIAFTLCAKGATFEITYYPHSIKNVSLFLTYININKFS